MRQFPPLEIGFTQWTSARCDQRSCLKMRKDLKLIVFSSRIGGRTEIRMNELEEMLNGVAEVEIKRIQSYMPLSIS